MTFINLINPFCVNFFIFFSYDFFFHIYKFSKSSSAKYYQENKERLQKKAFERDLNLSKEEKGKKWPCKAILKL